MSLNHQRFKRIYHCISMIILTSIIIWDRIVNIPKYPYCFCYLTQLDLYINTLYCLISLIFDYRISHSSHNWVDRLYDICFGLSFTCFIMFWGLILMSRNSLFKEGIEFPYFLSFLLHGGVFFICLCEQLYGNPRYKPVYVHPILYAIISVLYVLFLKGIYIFFGIKVYPFAYKSILMLIGVCGAGFVVSLLGHYLYYFLSNRSPRPQDSNINEEDHELQSTINATKTVV